MKTTFQTKTPIARLLKSLLFSLSEYIELDSNHFNGTPISKIPFNNNSKVFPFSFFKTRSDDIPDIYMFLDFISFPQPPVCVDFITNAPH